MKGEIFSVLLNHTWEKIIVEEGEREKVARLLTKSTHIVSIKKEEISQILLEQ